MNQNLTDEERAFVNECEHEFINRYTEKDYDYMLHIKIGMNPPPCVEPWYPKGENRDRNDGGYRNDRNDGGGYRNDRNDGGYRNDRNDGGYRKDRRSENNGHDYKRKRE
ncbi:unnamed protein product [Nezara viridula]|uniref:Uncharacterized protein n=1 Tax=Nezara viridula TaxID=85310 RepID=A0A9P0HIQ8_NEZVI|nr:unnamed protein product [Nezara viridula]